MTELQWEPNFVVFGGTFDPPHKGHLDCVEQLLNRFPGAYMLVVPSYQPPRTKDAVKHPSATFEHRYEMCKLTFAPFESKVEVSDVEHFLPCPNYTAQTLKHLHQVHKKKKLGFLMGRDQVKHFHRWFQPTEVLNLASLIVVSRGRKTKLLQAVESLGKSLSLPLRKEDERVFIGNSKPIFLLAEPTTHSASTTIRGKVRQDVPIPEDWLMMEVRNYIEIHQLYRGSH